MSVRVPVALLAAVFAWTGWALASVARAEEAPALAAYGRLPLRFEPNQGQADETVAFLARGKGYELFLTATESVLVLRSSPSSAPGRVLRMRLLDSNPRPRAEGRQALPGKSHYFIGSDRRRWRTDVPQYARAVFEEVYPGVCLHYHGEQGRLEYDFVVKPGADPRSIRLGIEGADDVRLDTEGNLRLSLPGGEVIEPAPVVYQEVGGSPAPVRGRFVLRSSREVGFEVGDYDPDRPLVIDPVLLYSTYLGGSGNDDGFGIAVDPSGNAYLVGETASTDFPTRNAFQAGNGGGLDAFVAKLDPTGSTVVYSTYLGGSGADIGARIAVDAAGSAYVTGETDSTDFPTLDALQPAFAGVKDAFVVKLDASGSLVYSTYLGGANFDSGTGIAVDASGRADVVGRTSSTDFPTAHALQAGNAGAFDAFVAKLDASGSGLVYATYLGGANDDAAYGVADDGSGSAYVTGTTSSTDFPTAHPFQAANGGGAADAFVAKLDASGSALVYSTYLGGSGDELGEDIAVDASGRAYVTGYTGSTDFPTFRPFQARNGGAHDAFVTTLSASGSALAYSTYLGGRQDEIPYGIAVDRKGDVYVAGSTLSSDFPVRNPIQAAKRAGTDAFVTKLSPARAGTSLGSLLFSTYLGGDDEDVAWGIGVDGAGNAYVNGYTASRDFPTRDPLQPANAGGYDGFVSKIGPPIR